MKYAIIGKHQFDDLSKKIIGAAIEVHSPEITQIVKILDIWIAGSSLQSTKFSSLST